VSVAEGRSEGRPSIVVFTGCDSETRRANGAMWVSRDAGRTWPEKVVVEREGFAYSVPVALAPDTVGVLYEGAGYKKIVLKRVAVPTTDAAAKH
jgi:hypothetical protein